MPAVLRNRTNLLLIGIILLIITGALFGFKKFTNKNTAETAEQETDLTFEADGPYALLIPRKDGNALILNLKRTASYEAISYELSYNAEGVDRGVVGSINTDKKKGEYEQEILFGTCSRNVCKYDKGVENGTLILHISKGKKKFKMVTLWHIQKLTLATGRLISGDSHFMYIITSSKDDLETTGYAVINDLTGVPKLPSDKKVLGKVYALNIPVAKNLSKGEVKIELVGNPPIETKIAYFAERANEWKLLDSKVGGSKVSALAEGAGIFAVLTLLK